MVIHPRTGPGHGTCATCHPPGTILAWLVRYLEASMKLFVLLFSIIFSAAAAAEATGGLRFFYCIHTEHSCDVTAGDVPVKSGNASFVARRALSRKDDFVGRWEEHTSALQSLANLACR